MLASSNQSLPTRPNSPGVASHKRSHNSSLRKRLIVNADDLGLSFGITDGILESHRKGIVTSASLMVNQPATEYAVAAVRDTPSLDVGIHLNLCQGKPVLSPERVPSLVGKDGNFLPPREISRKLINWQASPKEIAAEFCAQIDRMLSYGLTPSHADSHHRFHIYPAAASVFSKSVRSRGISRVRGATKQTWPQNNLGSAHSGGLPRRVAVNTYNHFLQSVLFHKLKSPDAGVSLHPKFRGKPEQCGDAWCFAFENMPAGTYEIWCHPGFRQRNFSETDNLCEQRELEAAMLIDRRLFDVIDEAGIELIDFREL
jgi:chitin disaccharide deacetylase